MSNKFVWTDELRFEFDHHMVNVYNNWMRLKLNNEKPPSCKEHMDRFIASKQSHDKKDYEIVSFKSISHDGRELIYERKQDLRFWYKDHPNHFDERFCLERVNEKRHHSEDIWSIHSVRRLSDGEVFTVGDEINFGTDTYKPIEKFTIENHPIKYNCQALLVWNKNNYMFEISLWKKSKPVLFTTEDGKPIYEGQGYAYIPKGTLNYVNITDGNFHPLPKDGLLYFSTEAAAKEYVLMNKPCLSVNDVISICADDHDTLSTRRMHLLNTAKLKQQP